MPVGRLLFLAAKRPHAVQGSGDTPLPGGSSVLTPWLQDDPVRRWEPLALLVLTLLTAALLLPGLERVPRTFHDETWAEAMAGYTLAFEGRSRNPGLMGWGGCHEYFIQPRLFPAVVAAPVYRVFGYGLLQSRAIAALFGLLLILGVYAAVRRLFGPVAATAISVLTLVDPWFFLTARQFRAEVFVSALLWWAFALLLAGARHGRRRWMLGGGALLGLSAWTHPNSTVFGLAFVVALTVMIGWRREWLKRLGWAVLSAALALAPYVAYVGYVESVSDVRWLEQIHPQRRGAYARPIADVLASEELRWGYFLRLPWRTPLLVLYLIGAGLALARGTRADRFGLLFVVLSVLLMPLIVAAAWPRYLVVLTPALAVLVWRMLPVRGGLLWVERGRGLLGSRAAAKVGTAAVLGVFAPMTAGATAVLAWSQRTADFGSLAQRVSAVIPPRARVMGNLMFWLVLHDRDFIASFPPNFEIDWPDESGALEHIRTYRPEYLLQESSLFNTSSGLGPQSRDLLATTFGRAVQQIVSELPAEVVFDTYDYHYGAVRVWRVSWSAPASGSSAESPITSPK
jgi:4-amino-4-deoxy-L-arabinose transferase-like glycosyltransferase